MPITVTLPASNRLQSLTHDIWHLLCDNYHRDWKTCNTALNSFERMAFKTIVVVLPVLPIHHKFWLDNSLEE